MVADEQKELGRYFASHLKAGAARRPRACDAIDFCRGPLPSVMDDPVLLRQVLRNLFSNAVKYTARQSRPAVQLAAESMGAEVVFSVADNGVGFDQQYAGRLFGVFQRLHRLEEFEGTGIGLANVRRMIGRRMIGRHGGRVWAEARLGRWHDVLFLVADRVCTQGDVRTLKPILIVEDNAYDLEPTLNALEKPRLADEVIVTRDAEEAADYLFRRNTYADRPIGNPAAILLDLKLPKIDGLELWQMARANEETSRVPIVLLSSSREESDVENGYRPGVNAYVVKPVDFQDCMRAIQDVGLFWAMRNEPPPGNARVVQNG